MALIGISGKKYSGKDTVANMIQYLTTKKETISYTGSYNSYVMDIGMGGSITSKWQIKRFADKVKDIVCLLINCTKEQLENQSFKEKPLGVEWDFKEIFKEKRILLKDDEWDKWPHVSVQKMTPRLLLQLVGTNCGRDIIHPNIWVNATFADYKVHSTHFTNDDYPDWIIPDVRFPNELKAIHDRKGIVIRVVSSAIYHEGKRWTREKGDPFYFNVDGQEYNQRRHIDTFPEPDKHESETALDGFSSYFNIILQNDYSLEELLEQLSLFLKSIKII